MPVHQEGWGGELFLLGASSAGGEGTHLMETRFSNLFFFYPDSGSLEPGQPCSPSLAAKIIRLDIKQPHFQPQLSALCIVKPSLCSLEEQNGGADAPMVTAGPIRTGRTNSVH